MSCQPGSDPKVLEVGTAPRGSVGVHGLSLPGLWGRAFAATVGLEVLVRAVVLFSLALALVACPTPANRRNVGTVCIPPTQAGEDLVVTYSHTCISSSDTVRRVSCEVSADDDTLRIRGLLKMRRMFGGGNDDCNVFSATCTLAGGLEEGQGWQVDYGDVDATLEVPSDERLCFDPRGTFTPTDESTAALDGCGC